MYMFVSTEVLLKMPIVSWYSAFALRNTTGVTIHSLLRSSTYETPTYSNGVFNSKSKIRFATRAVYSYFDSRHTGVFRSEAFLEAAIDCRYSSFRFLFPLRPLCSLSLPGARFSCRVPKLRCKIRAKSCDFSKEGFVQADDPRKQIKSAEVYRHI